MIQCFLVLPTRVPFDISFFVALCHLFVTRYTLDNSSLVLIFFFFPAKFCSLIRNLDNITWTLMGKYKRSNRGRDGAALRDVYAAFIHTFYVPWISRCWGSFLWDSKADTYLTIKTLAQWLLFTVQTYTWSSYCICMFSDIFFINLYTFLTS